MRKFLFSLIVISFYLLSGAQAQQLVSDTLLKTYSKSQVDSIYNTFGAPIDAQKGIEIYRIRYKMEDTKGNTTVVSGAVVRPQSNENGIPMVSYLHGTTTLQENVPSFLNREVDLGIIMAGQGFYVTMPDYLGLGESDVLHPYVHSETEAMSAIQLLRASRTFAKQKSNPLNDQLFILGYSQGGHAAMATHKKIEKDFSNEFNVTAAAPMSGPYDLSGVMTNVMLNDSTPYPAPAYLPYLFFGYQEVYDYLDYNHEEVFISPFDTALRPLFNGEYSLSTIADTTGMNGTVISNNDTTKINSIPIRALEDSVVQNFKNNNNHPLRRALRDNDTWRNWTPQAPIRLYFCKADRQVKYTNSLVAYDSLQAVGAQIDTFNKGTNKGHGECIQPSITRTILWFLQKRNVSGLQATENNATSIQAYPNPSDGDFVIKSKKESFKADSKVRLFNTTGDLLKTFEPSGQSLLTINGNRLSNGLYILEYQREDNVQHLKLVKN